MYQDIELENYNNFFKLDILGDSLSVVVVIREYFGLNISLQDARNLWEELSREEYCAGWLVLPREDRDVADMLFDRVKRINRKCISAKLLDQIPFLDPEFVVEIE